jgi:hypothetical protein
VKEFQEKIDEFVGKFGEENMKAIIQKKIPEITLVLLLSIDNDEQENIRYNILEVLKDHS